MNEINGIIEYKFADKNNLAELVGLLNSCNLHTNDIEANLSNFIIAKLGNKLIGSIGIEIYETNGLIRSVGVTHNSRNLGIAKFLYSKMTEFAFSQGVKTFYLLTESAEGFFRKLGFEKIDRGMVPEIIKKSTQFRYLCPENAVCMFKSIIFK